MKKIMHETLGVLFPKNTLKPSSSSAIFFYKHTLWIWQPWTTTLHNPCDISKKWWLLIFHITVGLKLKIISKLFSNPSDFITRDDIKFHDWKSVAKSVPKSGPEIRSRNLVPKSGPEKEQKETKTNKNKLGCLNRSSFYFIFIIMA